MKYITVSLSLILGFVLGETHAVKQQIHKQDVCIEYVLKEDLNLNKFFQEKITNIDSIFIHAFAATALKYENCMWSQE